MAQDKANPSGGETHEEMHPVGGEDRTLLVEVPPELGPYRLERLLGRGGMGEVWLALDTKLEREVAVKLMRRELLANEDAVKRFQREARAVAKLNHPSIVQVYSFGDEHGLIYFVMEMVEGETVTQRLKRLGTLPLEECVHILLQTTEGLNYASVRGVIHRDIKPSNLMVTPDFRVKIADFGLAKMIEQDTQMTAVGMTMGSPNYMSPEQAHGGEADPRSDIYSLGITFFQMLTGQLPFVAPTPLGVLMKQLHEPLPEPEELRKVAGGRALEIIKKMTEKDPEARYQTYGGVAAAISGLAPNVQVHSSAAATTVSMVSAGSDTPGDSSSMASLFSDASTRLSKGQHAAAISNTVVLSSASAGPENISSRGRSVLSGGVVVGALAVAGVAAFFYLQMPGRQNAEPVVPTQPPKLSTPVPTAQTQPVASPSPSAAVSRTPDAALTLTPQARQTVVSAPAVYAPPSVPVSAVTPVTQVGAVTAVVSPAAGAVFAPAPTPQVVSVRELLIGGENPIAGTSVTVYDEAGAPAGTLEAGKRVEYLALEPGGQRYRVRVNGLIRYVNYADGKPVVEGAAHAAAQSPTPGFAARKVVLGISGDKSGSMIPVYMDEWGKREQTRLKSGTTIQAVDETQIMYRVVLPQGGRFGYVLKNTAAQSRE